MVTYFKEVHEGPSRGRANGTKWERNVTGMLSVRGEIDDDDDEHVFRKQGFKSRTGDAGTNTLGCLRDK